MIEAKLELHQSLIFRLWSFLLTIGNFTLCLFLQSGFHRPRFWFRPPLVFSFFIFILFLFLFLFSFLFFTFARSADSSPNTEHVLVHSISRKLSLLNFFPFASALASGELAGKFLYRILTNSIEFNELQIRIKKIRHRQRSIEEKEETQTRWCKFIRRWRDGMKIKRKRLSRTRWNWLTY